jgi:hypothetical protein
MVIIRVFQLDNHIPLGFQIAHPIYETAPCYSLAFELIDIEALVVFDAPRTLKNVASTIVHPDWDPNAILKHGVSADVALIKLVAPLPSV